jgi:hypothetical protein
MQLDELLLQEVIALRQAVFGRDNGYTDWLAEYANLDEEPRHDNETDEQYKARELRVQERRTRLNLTVENEGK